MRRTRLLVAATGLLAIAAVSSWLLAAEQKGSLPQDTHAAQVTQRWPLTAAHGVAVRDDALRRASVWAGTHPRHVGNLLAESPATCRFISTPPTGTSAKFDCMLRNGERVKVKYGRNPEIHAEFAATRLLAALGFPADDVVIVPRLRCYGCPRFPFLATQLLALSSAVAFLGPHGHANGYSEFQWVAVEHKFPAAPIEVPGQDGWGWWELKYSQAPRADVDALRLVAMFLAHWDNKADNQRLVCMDEPPRAFDQPCSHPLLMIQDLGATFGPRKVNLTGWRQAPVWADRRMCTISMRAFPWEGGTFPDVRISEAGRAQLARRLAALEEDWIRALFREARFPDYHSGTDDVSDLDEWTSAFRHRVDQIVRAAPCPL